MKKILVILTLVFFDFLSKNLIYELIDLNTFIPLTFFLELTHIHNYGVSFGLFSNFIPAWILICLGLIITVFIYYLMIKSSNYLEEWALLIIICGALANIFDRSLNGFVIDFIYFHYKNFYWPAFNFADIYITIGIIMLVVNIITKINIKK
ncbi:MAG: signal peptidase II [Rickettsiales bacterium]|nr:signal peptidase II [Rickettsiales bacterium]